MLFVSNRPKKKIIQKQFDNLHIVSSVENYKNIQLDHNNKKIQRKKIIKMKAFIISLQKY